MAIDPTLASDIASMKQTLEEIYQLLYNGQDTTVPTPRPAYFKSVVDKVDALLRAGLNVTGTVNVKPGP